MQKFLTSKMGYRWCEHCGRSYGNRKEKKFARKRRKRKGKKTQHKLVIMRSQFRTTLSAEHKALSFSKTRIEEELDKTEKILIEGDISPSEDYTLLPDAYGSQFIKSTREREHVLLFGRSTDAVLRIVRYKEQNRYHAPTKLVNTTV